MIKLFIAVFFIALSLSVKAQSFVVGDVYSCAKLPPFIQSLGMSESIAIDTTVTRLPGVVLREFDGQRRLYQHPSWSVAGHVSSTVRDQYGNIYVIPVPSIGLDTNPLERRNIVYRIDAKTGVMVEFIALPLPKESSQSNPFGTLALALDCETNSLYVSSIAGSTASNVAGTIYRIDLSSKQIIDRYDGVDAIGLGIFNYPQEKRLFFGDARSSNVFSLGLTKQGIFKKEQTPKYEVSVLAVKNGDSTQVKKIRFARGPNNLFKMTLSDTEFAYRMQAETNRQFRHYEFLLDQEKLTWVFDRIR